MGYFGRFILEYGILPTPLIKPQYWNCMQNMFAWRHVGFEEMSFPYENLPMQYTENFIAIKMKIFSRIFLYFSYFRYTRVLLYKSGV